MIINEEKFTPEKDEITIFKAFTANLRTEEVFTYYGIAYPNGETVINNGGKKATDKTFIFPSFAKWRESLKQNGLTLVRVLHREFGV